MVYLVGFGTEPKKEIWAGRYQCPNCKTVQNHHLYRIKQCGYMFFIPIVSKTIKRGIVCDHCQAYSELPKSEYKRIKDEQELKFQQKNFPVDVIKQDYCPQELKLERKKILLAIVSVYSLIMLFGTIGMISDLGFADMSVIIGALFMLTLGFLPLYFAWKSLTRAKQKKALYDLASCNDMRSMESH